MLWWPNVPSPTDWFYNLAYPQNPVLYNLSYWSQPQVTKLVDEGVCRLRLQPHQAAKIIQRQDIVIQAAPDIFAYDMIGAYGVSPSTCWGQV